MIPITWLLKLGLGQRAAKLASWLVPLALICALCALLWARGEHYRARYERAERRAAAQVETYRETYRKTFLEHWRRKQAEEARTRKAKEKADAAYIDALEGDRDRAAAYAAANRCVRPAPEADPGNAGRAGVSRSGAAASQSQGAGDNAELVGIPRADFDACTVNSRRLENAVGWARDYEAGSVATEPRN